MRKHWMIVAAALLLGATSATAQDKPAVESGTKDNHVALSSSQVAATPEMWFYEQQLQQYKDPAATVRRHAEQRAYERRLRIAASKWFGYSNLRPMASPDPFNGDYSPYWAGNNSLYPYRWSGYGQPWVVVRPGARPY